VKQLVIKRLAHLFWSIVFYRYLRVSVPPVLINYARPMHTGTQIMHHVYGAITVHFDDVLHR